MSAPPCCPPRGLTAPLLCSPAPPSSPSPARSAASCSTSGSTTPRAPRWACPSPGTPPSGGSRPALGMAGTLRMLRRAVPCRAVLGGAVLCGASGCRAPAARRQAAARPCACSPPPQSCPHSSLLPSSRPPLQLHHRLRHAVRHRDCHHQGPARHRGRPSVWHRDLCHAHGRAVSGATASAQRRRHRLACVAGGQQTGAQHRGLPPAGAARQSLAATRRRPATAHPLPTPPQPLPAAASRSWAPACCWPTTWAPSRWRCASQPSSRP